MAQRGRSRSRSQTRAQNTQEYVTIVYPKSDMTSEEVREKVVSNIDKARLKVGVKAVRKRITLLKITKAFTTTSTAALQILAGTLPLDLKVEFERVTYRLLHFKESVTLEGSILLEEALLEPCFSTTSLHPASLKDFRWGKHPPSDQGLEIFTDGSKDDTRVGAVFHNSQEFFQDHFRVSDHATVFQAESIALRKAALWASSSDFNKISIYTDSMSVLQSMNKTGKIPAHIQSLKELVSTLSNTKQVTLHWVRGHQGTRGKERADILAKAATSRQDLDISLPISTRAAKHHIQEAFMSQWQERWEQGDTGRYTFAIFPIVRLSRVTRTTTRFRPFPIMECSPNI
ncbi:uncharacterized protein LOC118188917 [Stegodyphus dumicola]|uniref:uncharacterized protein LOC118188917 n=1 Tax=Stegodyphus dumicola TaxID=202533 RepID=UPI0015ABEAC2|nr:uncharacterized protein LOC118188917 [Stegodyphus dumicola]